jgi:hypothetical protein
MLGKISYLIKRLQQKSPIISEDEFIDWLSFANAGMLNKGNLYCFELAISNLPSDAPILEIGSFCGLSTNAINFYLSKYKKSNKLITSDKWIFENAENGKTIKNSEIGFLEYRNFVVESFKRNVGFFSSKNLPYTIEVFSDDFFELWVKKSEVTDVFNRNIQLGGPISFAYIDGNHTYEFAKRDFENTDTFLEKGGYILFDDSSNFSPFGCAKLMKEIERNSNYELVIKNPNYLFRKIN